MEYHVKYNTNTDQTHLKQTTVVVGGMSLVSLLSSQKNEQYFKLEVFFVLPSLVDPLSWHDDGIKGQTNILSNPPFLVDHGDAIYQGIGCRLS